MTDWTDFVVIRHEQEHDMEENWKYEGSVLEDLDRKRAKQRLWQMKYFRRLENLYRKTEDQLTGIPAPVRGGSFLYCPWKEQTVSSWGSITHTSCGVRKAGWATGSRFRTLRAYRRHWRKQHGPVPAVPRGPEGYGYDSTDEVGRFVRALKGDSRER